MLSTYWLLGLAVKESWLALGGPILTLTALQDLEKEVILAGKSVSVLNGYLLTMNATLLHAG